MKVAFVNALYWPDEVGGAERAVRSLAEGHAGQGGQSVVIALSPDGKAGRDVVRDVVVHRVPLANVGFLHGGKRLSRIRRMAWHAIDAYNPIMSRRLGEILDQERPDVVELNNLQGFSVAAWKAVSDRRIPFVQVLHDYYLGCANSSMYKRGANCERQCLGCRVLRAPTRRLSSRPSAISSVSQRTLDRVIATGSIDWATPVAISRTPIDIKRLSVLAGGSAHRAGARLTIGFLGRIEITKGIETLLAAVATLGSDRFKLLVGGEGKSTYVADLRQRFSSPAIEFLGGVDLAAFMPRVEILVVPSLWEEPLSRVLPEACASGVFVVASRIGGMPEIVMEGLTGVLFTPGRIDELVRILEELQSVDFPSEDQQEAMRGLVHQFDANAILAEHTARWRDVIAAARSKA